MAVPQCFSCNVSGWSAVGEPLQKTPGTVAGTHRETVAKKKIANNTGTSRKNSTAWKYTG